MHVKVKLIRILFGSIVRQHSDKNSRKRKYDSTLRAQSAEATRRAIVDSARRLFLDKGYAATTMSEIAEAAGTSLDTVYAVVGKKPALLRLLIELAISGTDRAVPAAQRDYVRAIRAEPDAMRKLRLYANAIRDIQPRLAPLVSVLQGAAPLDPELKQLWRGIAQRRADNMRLFIQDLATTGRLRAQLSESKAADLLWAMNSPEFYSLLVEQRRWPVEEYAEWLQDAWARLLLEP